MNQRIRHSHRRIGVFLLLALALLLGGCTAARLLNAQPPQVKVTDVTLGEITFGQQQLFVTLAVANPNSFALPIAGIDYEVRVHGNLLASGTTQSRFMLPANGRETVRVSVVGSFLQVLSKLQRWRQSRRAAVHYVLSGQLHLAEVPVALPFSYAGKFPIAKYGL